MPRSVALAYVLWFFLGYLGVHRVYLGHVGTGLLMAACTVVGGLVASTVIGHILLFAVGIWWLFDLVLTARMAGYRGVNR
ncbi:TM2 domain-containing protein [Alicyclobacillus vulcanalis]|uniref:TM2 domain-containing protein n=1 Tax=Alicyclobacillus vulcanalis TaxID=252246 RepID=A0A1N7P8F5_9BACL|nr:TM2 domain-containing protein [Alicyclobacillus vulcanalis]SIT06806.1 TM2 domain-containing protein [Alicyclobacillus vulcanalis]